MNILIKAQKEKKKIKNIINKYHKNNKKILKRFNILLDNYYRTSDKLHHKYSQKIFKKLYKNNFFLIKKKKQYYDKKYKQFLADRYVIGICPFCNYKKTYSDQCLKCGNIIENKLKKPISILSKTKPILKKTINFFIPFKKKKNEIIKIINIFKKKMDKKIIKNMLNFLKTGLHNRSITRDIKWGIKLPIKEYKKKVIYVWFEAILGYITATIKLEKKKKKIKWKLFWKNKKNKNKKK
ncbi:MAG: class I tRNA ligase family protein [Candidatus Shikimatogenerans bostrichidophilus]|nr:MAG: class I tRNA ligase family protein [Candidatus Shikimatogenerans bostrichidophilus]